MVLSWVDWLVIVVFLGISVGIGFAVKDKASGSLSDFFLGGRNLPWYIAGISMVATTFAADTPLAVAELVAQNGIAGNWLWWSFLAGGMLTTFFFATLWRRADIVTELELISIRYSGKSAAYLRMFKAVYLGVFMNGMIIGWVNLALNTLLMQFFGIPVDTVLFYTAAAMLLAMVYSAVGGLMGVALADAVQFTVAMIGTVALAYLVITSDAVGGTAGLKETLPADYFRFFPAVESGGDIGTTLVLSIGAFLSFAMVQWWASWYPGAEPGGGGYIAQRMMSVPKEKDAFKATLLFQIAHYCVRPWPWILVGLAAVALYSPEYASVTFEESEQVQVLMEAGEPLESALQTYAPQIAENPELEKQIRFMYSPRSGYIQTMMDFLPEGLKGLLLVAFLSAYLSTISTQLNMGASFLMNDLILVKRPNLTNKQVVSLSRGLTLVLMVLGLGITTQLSSISAVWEFIMEAGAGLGLVLILRWYHYRINAWSEITAMVAPFIGYAFGLFVLTPWLGDSFTEQKGTFLFTVAFTTVAWICVTYFTPAEKKEVLEAFAKKVRPQGYWKPVYEVNNNGVGKLFLSWFGGILLAYGLLIGTGKWLLLEWTEGGIALFVSFIGLLLLRKGLKE